MVLLIINGILALTKYRNFYFLSLAYMIIFIRPYSLVNKEKNKNAFPIQQVTITAFTLINLLDFGKSPVFSQPLIEDGDWLKRTDKRVSSGPHGVIWILNESLLQKGQAEILPELLTTEVQVGLPCHLRSRAGTHCQNP